MSHGFSARRPPQLGCKMVFATPRCQRAMVQSTTTQYKDNHIILTLKRQFIMTKETKENVQIVSAIAMLIGGFLLAVAGFIVPPTGQIHESVLGVFAECLIYAGSIFGVTIYIQTKYAELRSYLDDKLKRKEEKDAQA